MNKLKLNVLLYSFNCLLTCPTEIINFVRITCAEKSLVQQKSSIHGKEG